MSDDFRVGNPVFMRVPSLFHIVINGIENQMIVIRRFSFCMKRTGVFAQAGEKIVRDDVLFIDASGEGNYKKGKNQNILRASDIMRIVSIYEAREAKVDKYSYRASREEVSRNDYNLNILWYVDTFEEEEPEDIDEVRQNISAIEVELAWVQAQIDKYLEELGL